MTNTHSLTITTVRFGSPEVVAISPSDLYTFPEAIPGLPESHRYGLIADPEYAPLQWLQSLDEREVCLPVLDHSALDVDTYTADVATALAHSGITTETEPRILLVTRFDAEANLFAVNLLAPVVLDPESATGRQIVLDGTSYPLRQHIELNPETGTLRRVC